MSGCCYTKKTKAHAGVFVSASAYPVIQQTNKMRAH